MNIVQVDVNQLEGVKFSASFFLWPIQGCGTLSSAEEHPESMGTKFVSS